ncbi:carboxypeptidase-like regulatory domain-containing protein [Paraflavitalea sp. CAU 1676]|uniref:carboxypeptidase-like regulatory domain-containing protein n=1 Tax=Paraflavitalea sp. CAU 1676 TaxID=3032598 RepID=UPI0023DB2345|nr:carboxypeptidase-like regulatory domain-containing protein [Paraflavitalea sp. CAU 1676]MDF2190748.1 carboxypeptidase-like regulatory domain-containing protein [Paraflavitalea sp. CAU 1676]
MRKSIAVLLLTFVCMLSLAQQKEFSVLGKVIDSATRQPLLGASAFCQNTTHGTITNNEGLFFLRLPGGGYDLVISYTGYAKYVTRISSNQVLADTLVIELVKEEKTMTEVAVVASNEVADGLTKYGSFFTDHFIGTTPNASQCVLQNPEALRFFYTKKRNRLKVTAKEDLIVKNYALGYTIRYQLDSFSYDYNTNISQFTGYPFFQEMDSTDAVAEKWIKSRAKTYLGSRLHFMRSMFDSSASEEGFIVEKLDDDPKSVKGTIIKDLYDSTVYIADSNDVTINWAGRYRVSYKTVYPDKRFLEELKLPANTRMQVTLVAVTDGFVIEENGYFYEQYDVINTGYWAWKKLAELLPYNYEYE